MRTHTVFIPGVNNFDQDTGAPETVAWVADNAVDALDPGPDGASMNGLRRLRGLGDLQTTYDNAVAQLQSDTDDGFALGDGTGVIEADQADLIAATNAFSAATATMTPTQKASALVTGIPASTSAALQAANPNVFNASTLTQLTQQITAAMQNANLTSVQRQALQNQLATYQGGLFSSANMPWLMIGLAAAFIFASRK